MGGKYRTLIIFLAAVTFPAQTFSWCSHALTL